MSKIFYEETHEENKILSKRISIGHKRNVCTSITTKYNSIIENNISRAFVCIYDDIFNGRLSHTEMNFIVYYAISWGRNTLAYTIMNILFYRYSRTYMDFNERTVIDDMFPLCSVIPAHEQQKLTAENVCQYEKIKNSLLNS